MKKLVKKIIIKNLYWCMQGNKDLINMDIDTTVEEINTLYNLDNPEEFKAEITYPPV